MTKNILITGGAGFVGSNLAISLKSRLRGYDIICFDNLIRRGSELNVERLQDHGIAFLKGDIRNKSDLFALDAVHLILECSAEPSVLAAYANPSYTIETNLVGTAHCLELARRDNAGFIFLSSSRVYPIGPINALAYEELSTRMDWPRDLQAQGCGYEGVREDFPLPGIRSLYGATKLSSEHIVLEYLEMFGLKGVINRLGIIAGPWQMGKIDQGLVGFWVAQHKFGKKLSYIGYGGSGKQVRDALHVDDVCDLVLYQIEHLSKVTGKVYNAGGGRKNSFSLFELTGMAHRVTGRHIPISVVPEERKSDVRIYITDNSKIQRETGWSPQRNMDQIVRDIDDWISRHSAKLESILV